MRESPTDRLRREHGFIEMVVEAMEFEAVDITRTGFVDRVRVARMLDFMRNFTVRCHEHKEEAILFPALEQCDDGAQRAVTRLLGGHRRGHEALDVLDEVVNERGPEARDATAEGLVVCAEVLRVHMTEEEAALFPLLERLLSARQLEMLAEDLEGAERFETGRREYARYLSLARDLVRQAAA